MALMMRLIIVIAMLGMGWAMPGKAGVATDTAGVRLTAAVVTDHRWRVFSDIFPALPRNGYSISLNADGSAASGNFSDVAQWAINTAGELELRTADGYPSLTFRWYPSHRVLVDCRGRGSPPMILALADSYAVVAKALRELGIERC
ncbi:hypothetical protein FKG94_13340 [Exilibacterium tricleocarpae]|uniref:Uncharacterized protein n=1 Tax=Exilibacterium tricleocarpae TaxID=2591008 RepID=A0A545TLM7_9GAMM|nr:hypothetical protein [Exilibacterium tricleocarpae]TQV78061.1 hypothetical protein FKG94_13340 [Exilibacterium tricleocarpae]